MHDRLAAAVGGVCTLAVAGTTYVAISTIYSDAKAIDLIGQLSRSAISLGTATATSSASTLALMLTALGMSNRAEAEQVNINTL